jgi:hypothetical protein
MQKTNLIVIQISLLLLLPQITHCESLKISGKEFASSLLEVLNDMRVNPNEYISYLKDHFKILKKNVFNHNVSNSTTELDNSQILLQVESEIKNLQNFLETPKTLLPLKKNKHLTRGAQKIVKSNARNNHLKYRVLKKAKENKDLPKSKIILERELTESIRDLVNKEQNNVVSEIYQMTGKFHLSFRNMLNCLLMFLSSGYTLNDLEAKRNLLFFSNEDEQEARKRERERVKDGEDQVAQAVADFESKGFVYILILDSEMQIGIGVHLENQHFFITILMAHVVTSE